MSDIELLTSLHTNPRNPRRITPQQMERLHKALEEFGDLGGIVLNRNTNHLVGGHQRIAAFRESEIPAIITQRLNKPDRTGTTAYGHIEMFGTRYSYREVDWDEQKELSANIAANQHGGEFEWAEVSKILQELSESGKMDMDVMGFEPGELENLLAAAWEPPSVEDMPKQEKGYDGGVIDPIHLTRLGRELLDKCKVKLTIEQDGKAVEEICKIALR